MKSILMGGQRFARGRAVRGWLPNRCGRFAAGLVLCAAVVMVGRASAAEHNRLSAEELAEGWILLFDGESLFGWTAAHQADWKVVDGVITASRADQPGLLHTTSQFGDFALKVDFRIEKGGNSGVFLCTSPNPQPKGGRCYEVNIAPWDDNEYPTGSIVERARVTRDLSRADWQRFEITANGGRVTVKVNDQPAIDYTDLRPLGRGFIGLQFRQGKVEFRNIKLKPLDAKSLFNGKDLSGWKSHPESKSEVTVTPEGWLNVKNGRGMLETEGRFDDFTLQLECIVNGDGLNSGVFVRCIPGELMNGYECQIHNGFRDGDRSKPVDCGTGGFFRRQEARRVVADDRQWFHLTVHADGPHMAAWVNGIQVSDWTDTRKPDLNPRKGLRLEAGTIQLQGHDPTTDFSFRNLRVAPLEARR